MPDKSYKTLQEGASRPFFFLVCEKHGTNTHIGEDLKKKV